MRRSPSFKRVAVWLAAPLVLIASYVLGAPVVAGVVQARLPAIEPAVKVLYAPLIFYAQQPELPGSQWFSAYAGDVEQRVMKMLK